MKIISSCPLLGRIVFCTFFHSSQLSNRIHSIDANLSSTTALDGPKITHQMNWPFHETESPFVMQSSCGFRLFVEWGDSGTVNIHSVCLSVCSSHLSGCVCADEKRRGWQNDYGTDPIDLWSATSCHLRRSAALTFSGFCHCHTLPRNCKPKNRMYRISLPLFVSLPGDSTVTSLTPF